MILFKHALIAELTMKSNSKTMRLFIDPCDKFGEMRFIRENLTGKTQNPLVWVRDNQINVRISSVVTGFIAADGGNFSLNQQG